MEKAKIAEELKHTERQNREKDRNRFRRDSGLSDGMNRNVKRARVMELVRAVPMNAVRLQGCKNCGKMHMGECRKHSSACFRCGSMEHRVRNCPRNQIRFKF